MEKVSNYIKENEQRFLDELIDWLKIPSISTDPEYAQDVRSAADFLADRFREAGMETVEVLPTPGHPVVYAERIISDSLPTVLIYGHYDVQPPDPLELWDSPPFEPVIKNDNIYAIEPTK